MHILNIARGMKKMLVNENQSLYDCILLSCHVRVSE